MGKAKKCELWYLGTLLGSVISLPHNLQWIIQPVLPYRVDGMYPSDFVKWIFCHESHSAQANACFLDNNNVISYLLHPSDINETDFFFMCWCEQTLNGAVNEMDI